MPSGSADQNVVEYPLPTGGIDLGNNVVELEENEALATRNMVWKNGLVKRGGHQLHNTSQVVTSKKIRGLHRFYFGTSKQTLVSADDKVKKDNEDNTYTTIHTFSTADQKVEMNSWGSKNLEYIANGADNPVRYNGTDVVDTTLPYAGTSIEAQVGFTLTINKALFSVDDIIRIRTSTSGVDSVNNDFEAKNGGGPLPPEFDISGNDDATATSLAAAIDANANLSASASTNVVTVTPASTLIHIEREQHLDSGKAAVDPPAAVISEFFAAPRKAVQFLEYQDRLLSIDANDPGYLRWSGSYDDKQWSIKGGAGGDVRPDTKLYGMVIHSLTNVDAGYEAGVLLAGSDSMYLFKGTNLNEASTEANYTIYPLSIKVGCNAPRTMKWTPKGTMWLGVDKQVYLLPFDSHTPLPIGNKVISNGKENGINKIPTGQMENACAIYHDDYYKLSFAGENSTQNNVQVWLDMTRLKTDRNGHLTPWYGPMSGMNISIFAGRNGLDDLGDILAGDGSTSERGYVYKANVDNVISDVDSIGGNKSITCEWETFFNPIGEFAFKKDVHQMEIEVQNTGGTAEISYFDIDGEIIAGESDTFSLNLDGFLWGDGTLWGEDYWAGTGPFRKLVEISPAISPRRLKIVVKHDSSTFNFQIYALRVDALEQKKTFDGAV